MTEPAAAQAAPPAAPAAPAAPPAAAPAPPTAPVQQPPTPTGQPSATPTAEDYAKLQADLATWKDEARKHEGRWKTRDEQIEQQQTLLRQLAQKAGIEFDGKPDPDKLLQQVSQAQQAAADRARELAIFRAAAGANANADLLLDSRAFMAKTAELDPNAVDFGDRVKALVAEQVAANPALAVTAPQPTGQPDGQGQPPAAPATPPAAPLPASSGADFSGAPGGQRQLSMEDAQKMTPEAVSKAIADGLFEQAGIGRGRPRR